MSGLLGEDAAGHATFMVILQARSLGQWAFPSLHMYAYMLVNASNQASPQGSIKYLMIMLYKHFTFAVRRNCSLNVFYYP